jgi:UDP-glucose 4-epimerase
MVRTLAKASGAMDAYAQSVNKFGSIKADDPSSIIRAQMEGVKTFQSIASPFRQGERGGFAEGIKSVVESINLLPPEDQYTGLKTLLSQIENLDTTNLKVAQQAIIDMTRQIYGEGSQLFNTQTAIQQRTRGGSAAGMNSPYSISKKDAEEIVDQYCKENSLPFTIFRFYNVVGADGILPTNPDGLMWNLMNAEKTGVFNLFGDDYNTKDGSCVRDYTHVNEICYSVVEAIEGPTGQIENLGHGVGTTVKEMVEIYKRANNCDFKTIIVSRRAGDLESSVLPNPSKYMKNLYTIDELLKV